MIVKPEQATRLIGWADTTREKIEDIAACLLKMGEVAFADAYEQGRKMTLEQAVAYALRQN